MSTAPHEHRLAVGIDLGTTNSLVASVRSGTAEILSDSEGNALLPSVVRFLEDGKTEVGHSAQDNQLEDLQNTISSAKRILGRGIEDIKTLGGSLPYEFADDTESNHEASLGGELKGAVITVPAYFDDAQRQATKDAARLADLNVFRLLNEPTAAAVAYGLDQKEELSERVIAVYDLGGGTFDISILKLNKGVFEVMATGGDSALGGDDFDHVIAEWMLEEALLEDTHNTKIHRTAMIEARRVKEALTDNDKVTVSLEDWQGSLSRTQFDEMVAPLVKKTLMACRRALRDAGLNKDQAGNKPDAEMLLLDVIPLSLGLETYGGLVEKVNCREIQQFPITRAQEFTTFKDNQTAMTVHILQGERETVEENRSLAKFALKAKAGVEVKPSYGLTDTEIEGMIRDSMDNAQADMEARKLREQLVEADRTLEALDSAMAADADKMLNEEEIKTLLAARSELMEAKHTSKDAESC
ncbi:Chaperone protein HscA [Nymphon striatum]|nr:Chaperone protein HscA [Nymphon striatum]